MYRKLWVLGCGIAVAVASVVSCSIDSRTLSPRAGIGGKPGDGDAAVPAAGLDGGAERGVPQLALEPAALDMGQAVVGHASRARLAVTNAGSASLPAPSVSWLAGSNADFVVLHNQCQGPVAPGERCDVRVQWLALGAGPADATLNVASSGQSAAVPVAGVALVAGPLIVAPAAGSSGDFGGVLLGTSVEASFDVSNPTADASGPLTFGVNDAQLVLVSGGAGDCQPGVSSLALAQSCRVRITYAPARRGAMDATLVVTSSLGSTALALVGTGRAPQALGAPDVLDFGDVVVTSTEKRTLRVENRGDAPLTLATVALAGATPAEATEAEAAASAEAPSAFSLQNSECGVGQVLEGGASCSVTVAFRPAAATAGQSGELRLSAAGGAEHAVALRGNGLEPGALTLGPSEGSSADFGDVLVGGSLTRAFVVFNPSAQPSGPLDLGTSAGFTLAPPAVPGDCESGVTSLVDGQSCTVNVAFEPAERGPQDGALTVRSALAGAAHLSLAGRGLRDATFALASSELDFGRVLEGTPVRQTLTVQNAGEVPIANVQVEVEAPNGAAAPSFSVESTCAAEVPPGESCDISVSFLPADAAAYSAVLRLTSDNAGATSALLSGSAFPRGALVLAAALGSSDFGDVVLGKLSTLQFTLENPGGAPSGRLTITSSNNAFTIDPGNCNPEGGEGLASGATCSFSVTFTPISSERVAANLSVRSPDAGEAASPISGRGRTAPQLVAAGNRDFGVANVGQAAVTEAANAFSWVVTNAGDLETGALQIENGNAAEFVVAANTCSNASLPNGATCSIDLRFRPARAGTRRATLILSDETTQQQLSLAMTGTGVELARPGQSCANGATCATGVCTDGVCCDRACAGSCQVCFAGTCVDQADRQACGNGNGQCFGVDRCLLPEAQPCSGDEQCGDGNCERRLGGQRQSDRICCLDDCGSTGQQCDAQTGRCQTPTLGSGAACGAPGQAACGAGLECKTCRAGGSQCTPADECCGGCDSGYVCIDGDRCGCPTGSNGRTERDCNDGRCILEQTNACCSSADCAGTFSVCDGASGLCRECLSLSDCPDRGVGSSPASCTNFTCIYSCDGGFTPCNGGCIPADQCCDDSACGGCTSCVDRFCQSFCGAGQVCNDRTCEFPTTTPPASAADTILPCPVATTGTGRECGWTVTGVPTPCTPGQPITVDCGCSVPGNCSGDPVMRVCPGSTRCLAGEALGLNDDNCGLCPSVSATCPASGEFNVMVAPFNSDNPFTCMP